jgi:tetratricopeptide (TPR) repeat protein
LTSRRQGFAEAYARRAITARDHPADAYLTVGVLLDKRGRYGEALAAFQDALAVKPDHAEALRWAAVEAWRRADLLLQYRMIKAAFEAAPTDPFYLEDLATVMVAQLGDLHGMAAFMERALELDETNAAAHEQLGRAAAGLGDPERARRHLERARALRDAAERDLPS